MVLAICDLPLVTRPYCRENKSAVIRELSWVYCPKYFFIDKVEVHRSKGASKLVRDFLWENII